MPYNYKRWLHALFTLLLLITGSAAYAQPQYFVSGTPNSNNSYPFGANGGAGSQVQLMYRPTDFNSPLPSGFITKLWFKPTTTNGTNNITNLKVSFGNTSATTQAIGPWTPVTLASLYPSIAIPFVVGQWFSIDLQTPFYYDNTKNLVVEVSATGTGGYALMTVSTHVGAPHVHRIWANVGAPAATGADGTTSATYEMGLSIFAGFPCDEVPKTSLKGPKNVCPNKRFMIGPDSFYADADYKYEYSYNGVTWSNFTGLPGMYGEIYDSITKNKWYKLTVTCKADKNNTWTTPPFKVSVAPFYYCYCDNAVTSTAGADIGNVKVIHLKMKDTLVNTGLATPVYSNGNANRIYTSYHDSVSWPCLYQDTTYRFRITQINSTASLTPTFVQGYIDFNRDGLYNPGTEKIFNKKLDGTGNPAEVMTTDVTIPTNTQIGPTGMRLIMSVDSVLAAPCDSISGQGEVQDYVVNLCYRPCDGPTNAGNVTSTDTSMCNGYEYTIFDTTYERQRSGFVRSWQISGDDIYWQNITNSTNKDTLERSFTGQPLYYRLRLVCTGSNDTTYSPSTLINVKPGYKCYCYSKAIGGKEKDTSDIGGISINGFVSNSGGPHLLNATATRPRTDYTDIAELMVMYLDSTYNFSVYQTMPVQEHGDAKVTMFMDFNNNKQYDIPAERVFTGYTTIGYHTLVDNVTIPQYAITDVPTGMRFILNNEVGPNIPSDEACGPYTSGETEDFLVIFRKNPSTSIGAINNLTGFGLYPNPSTGIVHINFNTSVQMNELSVRVTNLTGQEVYKNTYEHKGGMFDQELNLGTQPKGVYFVELQSGGQKLLQKLVLQ